MAATLRHATADDATRITLHRHRMFADNDFATEDRLDAMDIAFEPWVRERLEDGRYIGMFVEEDSTVLAGGGIFFGDFPPHFLHLEACRPYLLNFYAAPEARGRGFAKRILTACVNLCHERGFDIITLHASPFGRPVYEQFGFERTNEMMLKLAPSDSV